MTRQDWRIQREAVKATLADKQVRSIESLAQQAIIHYLLREGSKACLVIA